MTIFYIKRFQQRAKPNNTYPTKVSDLVQIVQNILPTAYISTLRVKVSAKRKTKQHILNKSFRFSADCTKYLADSVHQYTKSKGFSKAQNQTTHTQQKFQI